MAELVRTNNMGIISAVEGLLQSAEIPYHVADRNMSSLEGAINAIQMRVLVHDDNAEAARQLLVDGDLGDWLRT